MRSFLLLSASGAHNRHGLDDGRKGSLAMIVRRHGGVVEWIAGQWCQLPYGRRWGIKFGMFAINRLLYICDDLREKFAFVGV